VGPSRVRPGRGSAAPRRSPQTQGLAAATLASGSRIASALALAAAALGRRFFDLRLARKLLGRGSRARFTGEAARARRTGRAGGASFTGTET
jgi:hypothetical protein